LTFDPIHLKILNRDPRPRIVELKLVIAKLSFLLKQIAQRIRIFSWLCRCLSKTNASTKWRRHNPITTKVIFLVVAIMIMAARKNIKGLILYRDSGIQKLIIITSRCWILL